MTHSMIWHENDPRTSFESFAFEEALDLNALIPINKGRKIGEKEREMRAYFSVCRETLLLREALLEELLEKPALFEGLEAGFAKLSDLYDLQKEKDSAMTNERLLYSVKELESYVEFLSEMKELFNRFQPQSRALQSLWALLSPLCQGEDFNALCKAVEEQVHVVRDVKSITVGINLNGQLQPTEAGLVAVHTEPFVSGNYLDKLLRLDPGSKEFTCSAPLLPLQHRLTAEELGSLRASVNSALGKVFSSALRSWSGVIKKHLLGNLHSLLNVFEEWKFVSAVMVSLRELKEGGYPLCKPAFGEEDKVEGLYHPVLALASEKKNAVVENDLAFSAARRQYILTGPNQGGKSIYTQSVGLLYAMLHLGLLLPAKSAAVTPVDAILVHFVDIRGKSYVHGRLSDECLQISELNRIITKNSLFLFDEALSSTDAGEATAISEEILAAYGEIGAKGIFTTHFHDLCRLEGEISTLHNLTAQLEETSHRRVFRILPGSGGKSYAKDIARAYGLTKEEILQSRKK
ncbi:MAG: hypothetical protein E7651_01980 [Ruminococcaceae bacterium]|nr:hypothetical protein [Oscillospiraceae bacterium]